MRYLLLLTFCLTGCATPAESFNFAPDVAVAAGACLLESDAKPDAVPAGDKCENCDGKGKVGDGTVFVTCPVCDGTGKPKSSEYASCPADCRCSEITWTRWTLGDGSQTWGPSESDAAYESFRVQVVKPLKDSASMPTTKGKDTAKMPTMKCEGDACQQTRQRRGPFGGWR